MVSSKKSTSSKRSDRSEASRNGKHDRSSPSVNRNYSSAKKHSIPSTSGDVISHKKNAPSSGTRVGLLEKSKSIKKHDQSQTKTFKSVALKELKSLGKRKSKTSGTVRSSSGEDVTPTIANTPVSPEPTSSPETTKKRVEKSGSSQAKPFCVWSHLMLGIGAVLLFFLVSIVLVIVYYFAVDDQRSVDSKDKAPSNDSTEKTPSNTSDAPDIIHRNSTSTAVATKESSFKVPLSVKIIGGATGVLGTYVAAGLAIRYVPCINRLLGDSFVFGFETGPVPTPPRVVSFTLTHPKDSQNNGITLGVWYIPPLEKALQTGLPFYTHEKKQDNARKLMLSDDKYVILVALGNSGSRVEYRDIYDVTRKLPYHVIMFDYRGNADSSPVRPTIKGLVADLRLVYDWILNSGKTPEEVLIWGYSLGTAVVIEMLSTLKPVESPRGAILAGAPVSLKKVIQTYDLGSCLNVLKKVTLLNYFIANGLQNNADFSWDSLSKLPMINCPLLFLHSEDDKSVSFEHGKQLYKAAKKMQPEDYRKKTDFHWFNADLKYGHEGMFKDSNLSEIIYNFAQKL